MAMNENPTSSIDNDNNISSNNQNHRLEYMIDIPLYAESKITRKQAIHEIADVILHSKMKPRTVEYALQLLQKLLPVDNTLPTTIDELFGAMMSSENDWRLAQYLIKHKQCPSFLPSSLDMWNENSNTSITTTNSFSIQHQQQSNISTQPLSPLFLPFNSNESSSSSDDENELTPYDRLQQCLRPITDVAIDLNLNYATSLHNSNNILSLDQRSQLTSSSASNPSNFLESFKRLINETSSTASTDEQDLFYATRILEDYEDDTENETSCYSTSNDNKKLCCFEINGYDLLNGGKRY